MKRICIAGPSECGKTTLAIHLSRAYWTTRAMASLVLDPWRGEHQWGKQAWASSDENKFWDAVWRRRNDLVIVDEASSTISRDRELIPVFTKIRHQGHTLLVICHDATDLLPTMRRNLNELFLFVQPPKALEHWQNDLPGMQSLELSQQLQKYEFVHCENFSTGKIKKLKL